MPTPKIPLNYLWIAIIIGLTINLLTFTAQLIAAPVDLQVQYVPDDGYYYLLLAKNFVYLKQWTFDGGLSVTSGFHLLFAYLLAGLFALLHPGLEAWVNDSLMLNLGAAVAIIFVWTIWAFKARNNYAFMVIALIISSQNFVYNTVSLTEWPWVVLVASLYSLIFFSRYPGLSLTDTVLLFVMGFIGSLARSDFGLFPLAILMAAWILSAQRTTKTAWGIPLAGFLGAGGGLLLGLAHNVIFTHELLQSSAKMKNYWAQISGHSYFYGPTLTGSIIGFMGLALLALFISLPVAARFTRKLKLSRLDPITLHNIALKLLVWLFCMGGYSLVYSRNGAIQPWYTANLMVPLLLAMVALGDYVAASLKDSAIQWLFSALFLAAIMVNVSSLYPLNSPNAPWPYHQFLWQAGQYLDAHPIEGKVGAWNAGIMGYYSHGQVVNIDGLVNNDIYDYAIRNDLPTYLTDHEIVYLLDFENMLTLDTYRQRGGYDQPAFLRQLQPIKVFDSGQYGWRNLTLYRMGVNK